MDKCGIRTQWDIFHAKKKNNTDIYYNMYFDLRSGIKDRREKSSIRDTSI